MSVSEMQVNTMSFPVNVMELKNPVIESTIEKGNNWKSQERQQDGEDFEPRSHAREVHGWPKKILKSPSSLLARGASENPR